MSPTSRRPHHVWTSVAREGVSPILPYCFYHFYIILWLGFGLNRMARSGDQSAPSASFPYVFLHGLPYLFFRSPHHERSAIDTSDQADAVTIFLLHDTDIQTGHGIDRVKTVNTTQSEEEFHDRHDVPIRMQDAWQPMTMGKGNKFPQGIDPKFLEMAWGRHGPIFRS
jgi:hypothetical protein